MCGVRRQQRNPPRGGSPAPTQGTGRLSDRPVFAIRLRAAAGVDAVKALRTLLKHLKRADDFTAIEIREEGAA
jgi:hypothetical protein